MKCSSLKSLFMMGLLCIASASKAETTNTNPAVVLPKREKLHLYLLMGQSNMAGRGRVEAEDRTPHPRVLVLTTNNTWELAVEPITHDRASGLGVGPGLAFGKVMAEKDASVTVGIVPCAVGGTALQRWEQTGDLYKRALERARRAQQDGTLKGMLWHQGESDSGRKETAETYGERLSRMIRDFRNDLGETNLPVVVGQLGEFLYDRPENKSPFAKLINETLANLPKTVPATACIESHGLTHKGDVLHFDAASEREMGRRYATQMLQLQKVKITP